MTAARRTGDVEKSKALLAEVFKLVNLEHLLQKGRLLEAVFSGDLPQWRFLGNLVGQFAAFKRRKRIGGSVNYVTFLYLFVRQTDVEVRLGKEGILVQLAGPFR